MNASSLDSASTLTAPSRKRPRYDSEDARSDRDSDSERHRKVARVHPSLPYMEPLDLVEFKVEDTPGADVYYVPNFINAGLADAWYEQLEELQCTVSSHIYHPTLKVYGKSVRQNRSIAAYSSSDSLEFKYSGHQVDMKRATDIPPILSTIWQHVSARLGLQFNCILINRYANGDENIGKHRDGKENGVIASLSLGAVRKFHLIPNRTDTGATTKKWPLANGSLLVMRGATQDNWKHEIPKEPEVKHGRISLTFRQLPEAVAKGQRSATASKAKFGS